MAEQRDQNRRLTDDANATQDRFDEALREVVEPGADDGTSCEDADATVFLDRFPVPARRGDGPKER